MGIDVGRIVAAIYPNPNGATVRHTTLTHGAYHKVQRFVCKDLALSIITESEKDIPHAKIMWAGHGEFTWDDFASWPGDDLGAGTYKSGSKALWWCLVQPFRVALLAALENGTINYYERRAVVSPWSGDPEDYYAED